MIKSINLSAPINRTSYGYVSQAILKNLLNKGIEVHLIPIGPIDPDISCGYDSYLDKCKTELISDAPHLIIFHQFLLSKYLIPNHINVGFPIFELDTFTNDEVQNINSCDSLIVCSNWAKGVIANHSAKRTTVAPLGVDPSIFYIVPDLFKQRQTDTMVKFLSIGKWEVRKNQLGACRAFCETFKGQDDVSLTFICTNEFIGAENQKWSDLMINICNAANLQCNVLPFRLESQRDINVIMNQHDAGIFPSRAEGYNFELIEMLELGKPCIATDYSGHTEFINSYPHCHKIEIDKLEKAYDGRFFFGSGNWLEWGENQHKQLCSKLEEVYHSIKNFGQNRNLVLTETEKLVKINVEGKNVGVDGTTSKSSNKSNVDYSWDNTVNCILKRLEESVELIR